MGYFANGSEGEAYQAKWCRRCVHDADGSCPVFDLHVLYNYGQSKKPSTASALAMFIPREAGGNGQCVMFWEKR